MIALFPSDDHVDNMVVRDKCTGKTKGYGFVSFANPLDLAAALKEMNETGNTETSKALTQPMLAMMEHDFIQLCQLGGE
ncbi:RNA-binding protein 42 [Camellia lanceoleosa]|uniref:RNA-binding protein 42 n=1 Tax=Camellia lanceoleosa TaxID=1840588 RepID=A0ACC0FBB2_9ERIC|nr:RNA-binding protein 42 [Camellia lanceoleosa]